jgi:phasin family protein
MQQQQAFFFEVYRSGLRAAADMMKTSLESAERMQNQQIEGIRGLMEENVRSTRQLSEASTIGELMAVQTRFANAQMERALDYWNRTWRTAAETQTALIGQAQNHVREAYTPPQAANIAMSHERKERKSA